MTGNNFKVTKDQPLSNEKAKEIIKNIFYEHT